jgi:hypothetical protein
MRCAKALTIVEIKWLTTITKLNDVVGIHAVLGPCLAAPVPLVNGFAPITSTGHHLGTPGLELGGVVDRIHLPGRQPCGAGVEGTDERGEGTQLGHAQFSLGCRHGRRGRIGLDPEHLDHDALELHLDKFGQHHLGQTAAQVGIEGG